MAASIKAVVYGLKESQLICEELCRVLLDRGHTVVLVSNMDGRKEMQHEQKRTVTLQQVRHMPRGAGAAASLEQQQLSVEEEASWLRVQKAQVVVSAAVPWACAAAAAAGVCAVCVANSTGGNATNSI